jgi:hypothetical protein
MEGYMRCFVKRVISLLLVVICSFSILQDSNVGEAYGASKYVTRGQIVQMIIQELAVEINQTSTQPYIEAAIKIGLISNKTFSQYDAYASKEEVAMLLVRADEYLNGVSVSGELVDEIVKKRISDISKVRKVYQPFIAKAYALGYIKGSSNGSYSKDRKFNPRYKVTKTYANQLVGFINNKEKRHQISPDGQLIRTTKLPEFVEYYPYILASFPNEYYDWEFMFMKYRNSKGNVFGTKYYVSLRDYAAPIDFQKFNDGKAVWYTYLDRYKITSSEIYKLFAEKWEENTYKYLNAVFNVDYKTLANDKKWHDTIVETYSGGEANLEVIERDIKEYIDLAIMNNTVIKSSKIAVDKSSLYIDMGSIYIRVYVKFCIESTKETEIVTRSPIVFNEYDDVNFDNIKLGEWRERYFNIDLTSLSKNCGIRGGLFDDYYHDVRVVK